MMIPGEYFPTGDAIIANKDKTTLNKVLYNLYEQTNATS